MSLEQAILENTKAIQELILALKENNKPIIMEIDGATNNENLPSIIITENKVEEIEKPKRTRTKKIEPIQEIAETINKEESKSITHDSVRELTQIKMSEGFDRVELKQMITALGFEKISDMDQPALIKLNSQLENLKK